jgi:hypothetical protein
MAHQGIGLCCLARNRGEYVLYISNFGGTVALGALVSVTLLCAMLANLVLLPSLLLSLEKSIANKQVLKKPQIDILPKKDGEGRVSKNGS